MAQGEGILFLFTDTQIVDEKMLVYVNDLLASGEIPDLFAQEDKDEIINALRSETKSMGLTDSAENCYMVFLQKVRPLHPVASAGTTSSACQAQIMHHLLANTNLGLRQQTQTLSQHHVSVPKVPMAI